MVDSKITIKNGEHVRVAIGPKIILCTISMMGSEFLNDVDTYQPFLDLVHFQAACEPRNWTIQRVSYSLHI